MSGGYIGGELAKNWGRVRSTESLATTDVITDQFVDGGDPLGVGIVGGYNFKPWNNNIVIGPLASFDYLNQTINHNFAGAQFPGTTTHWFIDAGVKAGVVTPPGFVATAGTRSRRSRSTSTRGGATPISTRPRRHRLSTTPSDARTIRSSWV
jgi:hypothetical protein